MNAQRLVNLLYKKGATLRAEHGDLIIEMSDDAFDDETLALVKHHKAEIISLVELLNNANDSHLIPIKNDYPSSYESAASPAQQRMLFMEELAGNSSYYNIPLACKLIGQLNKQALIRSLANLVDSNDVLRSVYLRREHNYMQLVLGPGALKIIEKDISPASDQDNILQALLVEDANYIFDLEHEIPIRVTIIAVKENEYVLSINIHHIAADGWSVRKILNNIGSGYKLFLNHSNVVDATGSARAYQYADYVTWQNMWAETSHYQESKDYWLGKLKGAPQLHSLPTDFIRPNIQTVVGNTYTHKLSGAISAALEKCARKHGTTPFVIFQAVFAALLARYSGETDIVFGTAVANRQPLEFINTIGLFVNTVVLRYSVEDALSFASLIKQAEILSNEALRHQQMPFDLLVDELQPTRSLGYSPLVQIMLVMQEDANNLLELEGIQVVQLEQRQDVSKFDMALHIYSGKEEIGLNWEYNVSLFKLDTIKTMSAHFETLLTACLSASDNNIACIPLVDIEPHVIAIDRETFPSPMPIHRLVELQVAQRPDSIALRDGLQTISYAELDRRVNRLAGRLYHASGGEVGNIGVCMERSAELIICMLAIFKIGAIYVPLDPHYPKERLEFMVQDSGMKILLSNKDTALPAGLETSARLLYVKTLLDEKTELDYPSASNADAPAYVIYTSGSTGKPKGVLVSHSNLFYSLHANKAMMNIGADDVMPTIGSQAFGVSLLEILLPLISGGQLHILKKPQVADIEELIQVTDEVTVLHAVPSLMRQWLDALIAGNRPDQYAQLRLLLVGGEAVPDSLLRKIKQWRPGIRLLELYGMTECAVVCSSYEASEKEAAHYCIGKPYPNAHFHVLNRQGQRQPIGVPGELHIGGLSIACEYINQPLMTAEKFINDATLGERLYKTGDRVRLLSDGNYEFLGRVDHQVSLRGA